MRKLLIISMLLVGLVSCNKEVEAPKTVTLMESKMLGVWIHQETNLINQFGDTVYALDPACVNAHIEFRSDPVSQEIVGDYAFIDNMNCLNLEQGWYMSSGSSFVAGTSPYIIHEITDTTLVISQGSSNERRYYIK